MNQLIISCRTKDGGCVPLIYQLLSNSVTLKFIRLLIQTGLPAQMRNTVIVRESNESNYDIEIANLRALTTRLAHQHEVLFKWSTWPETINQQILNALHLCFETFERDYAEESSSELRESFATLNRQIHIVEGYLNAEKEHSAGWQKTFFSAEPTVVLSEALQEADYDHMEIQLKPGTLYMGYYTIGKNFLTIFRQNDLALVEQRKVAPQTRINTQIVGLLGVQGMPMQSDDEVKRDFMRWWKDNHIDQYGYDSTSKSNLALGWFPLARLAEPFCAAARDQFKSVHEIVSLHLT